MPPPIGCESGIERVLCDKFPPRFWRAGRVEIVGGNNSGSIKNTGFFRPSARAITHQMVRTKAFLPGLPFIREEYSA
jgi:hypothetical protein